MSSHVLTDDQMLLLETTAKEVPKEHSKAIRIVMTLFDLIAPEEWAAATPEKQFDPTLYEIPRTQWLQIAEWAMKDSVSPSEELLTWMNWGPSAWEDTP